MKIQEITQAVQARVYHGSPYPGIEEFRFDHLRHRTGSPGTLAFTTDPDTALIYGRFIYECEVSGRFGDFENPEDCKANYEYRWPLDWKQIGPRYDSEVERARGKVKASQSLYQEICAGHWAMWENARVWRHLGWDGAWCLEHGTKNLIVGSRARIKLIRLVTQTPEEFEARQKRERAKWA